MENLKKFEEFDWQIRKNRPGLVDFMPDSELFDRMFSEIKDTFQLNKLSKGWGRNDSDVDRGRHFKYELSKIDVIYNMYAITWLNGKRLDVSKEKSREMFDFFTDKYLDKTIREMEKDNDYNK